MKLRTLFFSIIGLMVAGQAAHASYFGDSPKKTLIVAADVWCPINCSERDDKKGIAIDLAKRIFGAQGYEVKYVTMPWTDALEQVRAGKVDAVVGANSTDDPSLVFPKSPIFDISDDFYVVRGDPWRYQGPYTLKGKRIGAIDGYGYGKILQQFIDENRAVRGLIQFASGNNALQSNIDKLRTRTIDVVIESKVVMEYRLKTLGMDGELTWAGGVPQDKIYMAFSPANPASKERAAQYDAGLKAIAPSQLQAMYQQYGMQAP